VDEDGARRRIWIEPIERIVGEQDSILFADIEGAQALTAGAGAAGDFYVSRVAVLWGFASVARGG
jgi:hypothetical protein